jgi:hypothetical protein
MIHIPRRQITSYAYKIAKKMMPKISGLNYSKDRAYNIYFHMKLRQ